MKRKLLLCLDDCLDQASYHKMDLSEFGKEKKFLIKLPDGPLLNPSTIIWLFKFSFKINNLLIYSPKDNTYIFQVSFASNWSPADYVKLKKELYEHLKKEWETVG
ncbi:MAG TPA: hypothetical protein VK675_04530 [Candidatus Paceibacterota bacterium]|nr:hypothetical protein [Candidatus Paceibacterota bacterium]